MSFVFNFSQLVAKKSGKHFGLGIREAIKVMPSLFHNFTPMCFGINYYV